MYNADMHLSAYMTKNGLSDADVAKEIKRSRPTVSRIRRKLVRPDWVTIEKLKEFTKGACTADDFEEVKRATKPSAVQERVQ